MMSRKDYEVVATEFIGRMANPTVPSESRQTLIALANSLADRFAEDNPRFDREKFLTACGVVR